MPNDALGAYLRACRARVDPADCGLPPGPRRRVTGLRREEVAHLAGVSVDYYTRLEQGRDRHPSPAVLDALARVLRVDRQGRAYLARLAGPAPAVPSAVVRPELVALLEQWTGQAGLLLSPYRDVLASNALARAVNPHFVAGYNLLREVFLDPAAPTAYPDWPQVAAEGVAALRAAVGPVARDPVRDALVAELSAGSAEFARLWAGQDAREKPRGRQRFRTPAGVVALHYEPFTVADGQTLYVFFAAPGSADAATLARLR